ncbi:hypothetical protein HDA30_000608 [Micrococcus cohnii]|uniref:Uncharacterized protein n=1 Tax=Micrococcus cohnii TaxID=993416 RepID=A0A7W7GN03_9MICC|nr:hypothetical protein [Micrococcus cohnii]MBB4735100.1 hypothetical protein [Micrococcus cohnii]
MTTTPDRTAHTREAADTADVPAQLRRATARTRQQRRRREHERRITDPRGRLGVAVLTGLGYGALSVLPIGRLSHGRTAMSVGGSVAGLFGVGVVRSLSRAPELSCSERWRRGGTGLSVGGALGAFVGASTWCSLRTDAWLERTALRLGARRPRLWVGALGGVLAAATDFVERTPRPVDDDQDAASADEPARSRARASTTLWDTGVDPAITGEPPEEQAAPQ